MNNPVAWFEIYVEEMSRARAFHPTLASVNALIQSTADSAVGGMNPHKAQLQKRPTAACVHLT